MAINLAGTRFKFAALDLVVQDGGPLPCQYIILIFEESEGATLGYPLGDSGFSIRPLTFIGEGIPVAQTISELHICSAGYVGWDAEQLQSEIDAGAWTPAQATLKVLLSVAPKLRWAKAMGELVESISTDEDDEVIPEVNIAILVKGMAPPL